MLWVPVAMGAGIAFYFALSREPAWFAGPIFLALSLAGLVVLRRGGSFRLVLLLSVFAALGFSAAQWRSHSVAAPVLAEAQITTMVEGRVVTVEPAARGPRVVLEDLAFADADISKIPERVRLRLRARKSVV